MTWREPTEIRLPDGRIFQISDLVGRRTRGQNYNLRSERRVKLARQTIDDKKIPKSLYQSWSRKPAKYQLEERDRKSTRLNSSHIPLSRMPSSA